MSMPNDTSEVKQTVSGSQAHRRKRRRILTFTIGAAAFLAAGSIVIAFVGKIQDAADRTH